MLRLVLPIPLYLLLPQVFLRLDWFSWFFHRLDAKPPFPDQSVLSFIRLDLALHIVPRIRYLGFTLEGRRVTDYDGGLVRLQVQTNVDTNIYRQHSAVVTLRRVPTPPHEGHDHGHANDAPRGRAPPHAPRWLFVSIEARPRQALLPLPRGPPPTLKCATTRAPRAPHASPSSPTSSA
jgi:hypothetical protein